MRPIRLTTGRRRRDTILGAGLAFGLGVGIAGAAWNNSFDWNGGDLNVNVDRNNFTNIDRNNVNNLRNRTNSQTWQHNADNRRGTNYRDQATRERFGQGNSAQANARRDFRGFDQGQGLSQFGDRGAQQLGQRSGFERSGQREALTESAMAMRHAISAVAVLQAGSR